MGGKSTNELDIRLIALDDVEEVAQLFSLSLTRDSLSSHFSLSPSDIYPVALALTLSSIPLSFVCEDLSRKVGDRIVGFRLAHHFNPSSPITNLPPMNSFAPFYAISHIIRLWTSIHAKSSLLNNIRIVHLLGLGIKEGYERQGIAAEMVKATLEHAQTAGYDKVIVEALGGNTQRIFEKLQFKKELEISLNEVEVGGKRVLADVKGRGVLFVSDLTSGNSNLKANL